MPDGWGGQVRPAEIIVSVLGFTCTKCARDLVFHPSNGWRHRATPVTVDGLLICTDCAREHPDLVLPDHRLCRRCGQSRHWRDFTEASGSLQAKPGTAQVCTSCRTAEDAPAETTTTCASCGSGFTARRSDARYCSGRCRVAAHRARVTRETASL